MKKSKYRIAIMTQSLGFNYGGIIQNYALQKVLTDRGHSTVTIDRAEENPHLKLKIVASRYKSVLFRYILKQRIPTFLDDRRISATNRAFIKKNIKLSPTIQSTSALASYFSKKRFDVVVVGSDQVWRPRYSFNIFNFFLDFLQKNKRIKKVAYAASFGTDEWEYTKEQTRLCSDLIQEFDGVSVREDSGVTLCAEYLNRKDVISVLDPTLLLNADDYSKLIDREKVDIGLFTYVLDQSNDKLNFIKKCARLLNLNVHNNQAMRSGENVELAKIADYIIPPIEGWLQGYRDAEFIITDSFHGTVFSIINAKPFFVLVNEDRGSARFESILRKLGLEDRLIYDLESFNFSTLTTTIDYKEVFKKLNLLKDESIQFINKYF